METRKSLFWTFVFGCIPGAGEMYLGMMRKGCLIMAAFWGISSVATFFGIGALLVLLPVIWFYSFFDSLNSRTLTSVERIQSEEQFLNSINMVLGKDWKGFFKGRHAVIGILLIAVGIYGLFDILLGFLVNILWEYMPWVADVYHGIIYRIPNLIVACIIIYVGYLLTKSNHPSAKKKEDFVEFKGDDDNHE